MGQGGAKLSVCPMQAVQHTQHTVAAREPSQGERVCQAAQGKSERRKKRKRKPIMQVKIKTWTTCRM